MTIDWGLHDQQNLHILFVAEIVLNLSNLGMIWGFDIDILVFGLVQDFDQWKSLIYKNLNLLIMFNRVSIPVPLLHSIGFIHA